MHRKKLMSAKLGLATLMIASVLGVPGIGVIPAIAANFTGGLSPTIYGNLADLNGDGVVTGADDANEFYGSTSIIGGGLDCDAWTGDNSGEPGDLAITVADDCTLIGHVSPADSDGVTIGVVDGAFATADGVAIPDGDALPKVFNAAQPDNPSVFSSDFAWSTIGGRVDSNGNADVDPDDCHFGFVDTTDVLGSGVCGFAGTIAPSLDGFVDLNSDEAITGADTCRDGCIMGHDVVGGLVGPLSPCTIDGTSGNNTLTGTPGRDVICGYRGRDIINGRGGRDLILGGRGNDVMMGGRGNDTLMGGRGPDSANGGPGRDRCRSAVTQRSCER